jgi:hypothetical protein
MFARVAVAVVVAGAALTGCNGGSGDDSARSEHGPVSIDPANPGPLDAVEVRATAIHRREIDGANYHFTLRGPTGRRCNETFRNAIGVLPSDPSATDEGGRVIVRTFHPARSDHDALLPEDDASWCPGRYVGAVDYRIPGVNTERRRVLPGGIPVYGELVGRFSFEVPDR